MTRCAAQIENEFFVGLRIDLLVRKYDYKYTRLSNIDVNCYAGL